MSLGSRIKHLRAMSRFRTDQAGLAQTAGVSRATLSAWENDKAKPTAFNLLCLAEALGVPAAELVPDPEQEGFGRLVGEAAEASYAEVGVPDESRASARLASAIERAEDKREVFRVILDHIVSMGAAMEVAGMRGAHRVVLSIDSAMTPAIALINPGRYRSDEIDNHISRAEQLVEVDEELSRQPLRRPKGKGKEAKK